MNEQQIRRDFRAAVRAMTAADFAALREIGVTRSAIFRAGMMGTLRILPTGRTFMPAANGDAAWVVGAWYPAAPGNHSGIGFRAAYLDDLLAFDSDGRWWYRHGARDQVLGPERLAAAFDGAEVAPSPSPLAWLQGGCLGFCPLGLVETGAAA